MFIFRRNGLVRRKRDAYVTHYTPCGEVHQLSLLQGAFIHRSVHVLSDNFSVKMNSRLNVNFQMMWVEILILTVSKF